MNCRIQPYIDVLGFGCALTNLELLKDGVAVNTMYNPARSDSIVKQTMGSWAWVRSNIIQSVLIMGQGKLRSSTIQPDMIMGMGKVKAMIEV